MPRRQGSSPGAGAASFCHRERACFHGVMVSRLSMRPLLSKTVAVKWLMAGTSMKSNFWLYRGLGSLIWVLVRNASVLPVLGSYSVIRMYASTCPLFSCARWAEHALSSRALSQSNPGRSTIGGCCEIRHVCACSRWLQHSPRSSLMKQCGSALCGGEQHLL